VGHNSVVPVIHLDRAVLGLDQSDPGNGVPVPNGLNQGRDLFRPTEFSL
jgi:hypothetical protein